MSTINNDTSKDYKDLKAHDYFIGKIKIIELVERYKLKYEYMSEPVDINKYKTEGYIPSFHSRRELKIGKTYEIRGYMFEDGYLRTCVTKESEQDKSELESCT